MLCHLSFPRVLWHKLWLLTENQSFLGWALCVFFCILLFSYFSKYEANWKTAHSMQLEHVHTFFFFFSIYSIYLAHVTGQIEWESRMSQNLQWCLYCLVQPFKIKLWLIQRAEILQWSREKSQCKVGHLNECSGRAAHIIPLIVLQDMGWRAQLLWLHEHTCAFTCKLACSCLSQYLLWYGHAVVDNRLQMGL